MNDLRKAAEMALEFVEWLCSDDHSVKPKNNALKTREALRQALNDKPVVKSYCGGVPNYCTPVDAVNMTPDRVDETAKGEHEPVAWCIVESGRVHGLVKSKPAVMNAEKWQPLYTAPPKREWVGLTDNEIVDLACSVDSYKGLVQAVETKLKEKNGG